MQWKVFHAMSKCLCLLRMVIYVLYNYEGLILILAAAILRDPLDIESPVSDENKTSFYADAELDVRCLSSELETKYL